MLTAAHSGLERASGSWRNGFNGVGEWLLWNRSWQLMPLLWPAGVDGGNSGLITPVSTNQRSSCVTAPRSAPRRTAAQPNLSACILAKWIVAINVSQWSRGGGFCSGGRGGLGGGGASGLLWCIGDLSFWREPCTDRCAGVSSYFTGGASGMGDRGGEVGGWGGKGEDGIMARGSVERWGDRRRWEGRVKF